MSRFEVYGSAARLERELLVTVEGRWRRRAPIAVVAAVDTAMDVAATAGEGSQKLGKRPGAWPRVS